jgi:signal peptidase I
MNKIQRIIISLGITVFAVCCCAILLLNWHALGYKTLDVPTGSMRPTIQPGSLVLMHSVPISTIKVGDIITYINPRNMRETISHRVIKTYTINGKIPAFITKGDANKSADPPIVGGLVKGQVIWHMPYLGTWMQWSKTWTGVAILIYLPALLLMVDEVRRLSDYLREMQPYKLRTHLELKKSDRLSKKYAAGIALTIVAVVSAAALAQPALAALKSNTVVLANNRLTVPATTSSGGGGQCSGNNNNNVNVTSNNNQTATTGNAGVDGNTTGGSASSGNASNSNNTNVNITITNC